MKGVIKSIFLIASLFLLSGCMKVEYKVGISDDKSVNIEVIYLMDTSALDEFSYTEQPQEEINKDDYKKLKEKGWKVEDYSETIEDKTYKGVKVSKSYPNIDDITTEVEKNILFTDLFNEEVAFNDSQLFSGKNGTYKAKHSFDFSSEDGEDYSSYLNMFDLKYKLTLPTPAIKTNASIVSEDKKTLTWNFIMGRVNEVEYEFFLKEVYNPNQLIISLGSLTVLSIMSIAALIVKNKRDKNLKNNIS
jgi:hypothetical protein